MQVNLNLVRNVSSNSNIKSKNQNSKVYMNPILKAKRDTVSFGIGEHIDDELAKKDRKLENIEERISEVEAEIEAQELQNIVDENEFDEIIGEKEAANRPLAEQIRRMTGPLKDRDKTIEALTKEGKGIEQELDKLKKEMDRLANEQTQMAQTMREHVRIVNATLPQKISAMTEELEKAFKVDIETFLTSPKSLLIQHVFNPVRMEQCGEKVEVPSGILLTEKNDRAGGKVFKWIANMTNSNYAKVNAHSKRPSTLIEILQKLARKSQLEFEGTQKRTFIHVSNFDEIAAPTPGNEPIIGAMKNFMDVCSKDYHCTVVASASGLKRLDPILLGAQRFPVKVKLDKAFAEDRRIGYMSIIRDLKSTSSKGKRFRIFSLRALFNL